MKNYKVKSLFHEFFESESASGVFLIAVTILALVIANSFLNEYYQNLLHVKIKFGIHGAMINMSLHHWINDGLMAIFFLVIGLEIKRELISGELSNFRSALLPIVAAVGGAIIPAGIFLLFNYDSKFENGWGITMATDIAFAVGILTILGSRIPLWAKVFLSALAVVDDLIAVLVIAIFYTSNINSVALIIALLCLFLLGVLNFKKVKLLSPYLIVGFFLWFAVLKSGVHATIAGVLLGFLIPIIKTEKRVELKNDTLNYLDNTIESPLHRLEHKLHGFSAFVVVPIFAFANAGVIFNIDILSEAFSSPLTYGIITGLFIGKQIGVFGATYILTKLGLTNLRQNKETWIIVYGLSLLSGIGFTMSLFVSGLAFNEIDIIEQSKIGILFASFLAGVLGYLVLNIHKPNNTKK